MLAKVIIRAITVAAVAVTVAGRWCLTTCSSNDCCLYLSAGSTRTGINTIIGVTIVLLSITLPDNTGSNRLAIRMC